MGRQLYHSYNILKGNRNWVHSLCYLYKNYKQGKNLWQSNNKMHIILNIMCIQLKDHDYNILKDTRKLAHLLCFLHKNCNQLMYLNMKHMILNSRLLNQYFNIHTDTRKLAHSLYFLHKNCNQWMNLNMKHIILNIADRLLNQFFP